MTPPIRPVTCSLQETFKRAAWPLLSFPSITLLPKAALGLESVQVLEKRKIKVCSPGPCALSLLALTQSSTTLGNPNIQTVLSPTFLAFCLSFGEKEQGRFPVSLMVCLIYLNLEGLQPNQTAINSFFIRGLHVCLLHMNEPQGHTVPLKRELLKVRAGSPPNRSSLPFCTKCSFLSTLLWQGLQPCGGSWKG